ncbi:MAG: hypothetical protein LW817_05445 [Candidatus Caenarcaniphilales bacterium]|jgi:hypothetical protein|nr:hypothetical protein [Candidatus Caenarcaniphilales bacterium]
MLQVFKLLAPIFIPAWQFFREIAPSPRIEYALDSEQFKTWHEFNLRPQEINFWGFVRRIFYNREWNEMLFIMNCAEKLITSPNQYSSEEILKRLKTNLKLSDSEHLKFRLVFVSIENGAFRRVILHES